MPASFETVRKMALALDNVAEGTSYGTAAFKVDGKLFARLHQDGDSLIIRMDFNQREDLIALDPHAYYITDHYVNYEWMLVRLSRVRPDTLRELIHIAWKSRASEKSKPSEKSKSTKASMPSEKSKSTKVSKPSKKSKASEKPGA